MTIFSKEEARNRLKHYLPLLPEREEYETKILKAAYPLLKNTTQVISYVADRSLEVDILPLIESSPLPRPTQFWEYKHSAKWYFPKINAENHLVFIRPLSWTKGKFGIWEPVGEDQITPEQADLVFVPALGYSEFGKRLGRGGGYYDRVLSDPILKEKTIGLTFSKFFPVPFSPDPHDCQVGKIITEVGVRSFLD